MTDFDDFASDPLHYARTADARPTEAQERVARELKGFHVALIEQGFTSEDAIAVLGSIFAAKEAGEAPPL